MRVSGHGADHGGRAGPLRIPAKAAAWRRRGGRSPEARRVTCEPAPSSSCLSTPSSDRHSTLLPSLASALSQIVLYLQALACFATRADYSIRTYYLRVFPLSLEHMGARRPGQATRHPQQICPRMGPAEDLCARHHRDHLRVAHGRHRRGVRRPL